MHAHIIYENDDWMPPLRAALHAADVPYDEWFIHEGHFDVTEAPPNGVFLNRMSASSYTRGHAASVEAFEAAVKAGDWTPPPARITLLQQYIEAAEAFITRCEFVDGTLQYAITSDTSDGFELCPADACRTDAERCAIDGDASLFALREDVPADLIDRYTRFLRREQIDIAGIEFIEDAEGRCWTYDINGTTNYSPEVEDKHGLNRPPCAFSSSRTIHTSPTSCSRAWKRPATPSTTRPMARRASATR